MAPPTCPSCNTPLALFTPREAESHVNLCLDLQDATTATTATNPTTQKPTCAVCERDLSALTCAAREEHANRCADSILPLPPTRRNPPARRPPSSSTSVKPGADGSAVTGAPATPVVGDGRVAHLLTMLGLQRFCKRFADEEIDLIALRLLSEDDLAALAIPEAARRRLADAMHSVPILAELQRAARLSQGAVPASGSHAMDNACGNRRDGTAARPPHDGMDILPTQRFAESRLARHGPSAQALLDDASDGEEYAPTPVIEPPVVERPASVPAHGSGRAVETADYPDGGNASVDDGGRPSSSLRAGSKGSGVESNTRSTSSSSFASDLANLDDGLLVNSQISIERKLRKWKRRQIQRERCRHRKELARIEERYSRALQGDRQPSAKAALQTDAAVLSGGDLGGDHGGGGDEGGGHGVIDLTHDFGADASGGVCVISSGSAIVENTAVEKTTGENSVGRKEVGDNTVVDHVHMRKDSESSSSSLSLIDFCRVERVASGQAENDIEECWNTGSSEHLETGLENKDSDDEEILDLIGIDKENDALGIEEHEEIETQSRLKKRRRPGNVKVEDIKRAIRSDEALYDDMLMMKCIPFDRFLDTVRGKDVNVSKKAMHEFLVGEGIMFGSSIGPQSQQAQQFMQRLNADQRIPSD